MQTGNPTNSVWKRNETEIDAINFQAHNRHMASEKKKLTHDEIHALRGKYKLMPADKPFVE